MKIVAVIHARMSSSRLPGKALKDLAGRSVFFHHYRRISRYTGIDKIYLATSKDKNNIPLIEEAKRCGLPYYAGAEEDVIERYLAIMDREKADAAVRCGCDKPLASYEILEQMLNDYKWEDFLSVSTPLPQGIGTEIFSYEALEKIHSHYAGPAISKYIFEYPHLFKIRFIEVDGEFSRPEFRLCLDTENDYKLIKVLYEKFYIDGNPVDLKEVFRYLDDNPQIANINRFEEEKQINKYVKQLNRRPVFTIYQASDGKYMAKNRMNEVVPPSELVNALKNMEYEV